MKALTEKEKLVMDLLWDRGPMFVREMIDAMDEPRPHFNTVSTFVRLLEQKGFIGHEKQGNSYRYYASISRSEYSSAALTEFLAAYYNNKAGDLLADLIKSGLISDDDLWDLMAELRMAKKNK